MWAAVDAPLLERALLNLPGNAHKHGRGGGRIRLGLARRAAEAVLSVADDGPGIAAADQARLFERFYRAGAEGGPAVPGSGLGLAIARAMVDLHRGRLWVESAPGHGATFHMAVPTHEPAGRRGRAVPSVRPATST